MKRLGENDAVEGLLRQHAGIGEVTADCALRVAGAHMEHILSRNPIAAEATRIGVVADLEHSPMHICRMLLEKGLDVMAVDRRSAAVTELDAERRHARCAVARHYVPAAGAAQGCSEPIDNRAERHPR